MIKISGNSNYKVSVIYNDNQFYISKESFTYDESQRLKKQIEKQENFIDTLICTPKVIEKNESKYTIQYIRSYDIINYLDIKSINHIKKYINNKVTFLKRQIKESIVQKIDLEIIQRKINTIEKNLTRLKKNKTIQSSLKYLYDNNP